MSDLILKEIFGKYGTKSLTKEQIRRYKMNEIEISEKYDDLSENELNEKSNERVHVKNYVITFVIKHCKGEKKRGERSIDGFIKENKDCRIWYFQMSGPQNQIKIDTIFANEKIFF